MSDNQKFKKCSRVHVRTPHTETVDARSRTAEKIHNMVLYVLQKLFTATKTFQNAKEKLFDCNQNLPNCKGNLN